MCNGDFETHDEWWANKYWQMVQDAFNTMTERLMNCARKAYSTYGDEGAAITKKTPPSNPPPPPKAGGYPKQQVPAKPKPTPPELPAGALEMEPAMKQTSKAGTPKPKPPDLPDEAKANLAKAKATLEAGGTVPAKAKSESVVAASSSSSGANVEQAQAQEATKND